MPGNWRKYWLVLLPDTQNVWLTDVTMMRSIIISHYQSVEINLANWQHKPGNEITETLKKGVDNHRWKNKKKKKHSLNCRTDAADDSTITMREAHLPFSCQLITMTMSIAETSILGFPTDVLFVSSNCPFVKQLLSTMIIQICEFTKESYAGWYQWFVSSKVPYNLCPLLKSCYPPLIPPRQWFSLYSVPLCTNYAALLQCLNSMLLPTNPSCSLLLDSLYSRLWYNVEHA